MFHYSYSRPHEITSYRFSLESLKVVMGYIIKQLNKFYKYYTMGVAIGNKGTCI